jgi:hypothetical protein
MCKQHLKMNQYQYMHPDEKRREQMEESEDKAYHLSHAQSGTCLQMDTGQ